MKTHHVLALLSLLATLLLSAVAIYADDHVIKLGFIGPLSGSQSSIGIEAQNALKLALKDIEASKLIPERSIEVIYEDGKCQGKDASIAAQKLITIDKVKFILGGVCSGETLGAAPVAERSKVILFSAFSSNPQVSKAGDFIFRLATSDDDGGHQIARAISSDGFKRVAIISENTEYCAGVRAIVESELGSKGINIVRSETYNPGQSDFRSIILRVQEQRPEALFLNPNVGNAAGLLAKQIKELGWNIELFGTYAFSSADAQKAAGGVEKLEGMKFMDAPVVTGKIGTDLLDRYKAQFGAMQSDFLVAASYDTALLLAKAIAAGNTSPENVRDYFYSLKNYEGTLGQYHFDKNGDIVGLNYVIKRYSHGKIELVPMN